MRDIVGAHNDLHSDQGGRAGEHPGRSRNPVIKVHDLAWLEFEKPDLVRAEAFANAFGFQTVSRGPDELQLRGTDAGASCVIVRRGQRTRFCGLAFRAQDESRRGAPRRLDRRASRASSRGARRDCGASWPTPAAPR